MKNDVSKNLCKEERAMSKYVRCPICELNYVKDGEKCCSDCALRLRGKPTIADDEVAYENYRQTKMDENQVKRRAMEDFFSYRFNRAPRNV